MSSFLDSSLDGSERSRLSFRKSSISKITLRDETVYEVPSNILMGPLLTPCGNGDEEEEEDKYHFYIPSGTITKDIFEKILNFLRYYHENPIDTHKDIDRPLRFLLEEYLGKKPEYQFYQDFLQEIWDTPHPEREGGKYIELILEAVFYLDIKPIYDLCCAKYASEMKSKSYEEIRSLLIKNTNPTDKKLSSNEGAGAGAGSSV
jgi:hypothetical protein